MINIIDLEFAHAHFKDVLLQLVEVVLVLYFFSAVDLNG